MEPVSFGENQKLGVYVFACFSGGQYSVQDVWSVCDSARERESWSKVFRILVQASSLYFPGLAEMFAGTKKSSWNYQIINLLVLFPWIEAWCKRFF